MSSPDKPVCSRNIDEETFQKVKKALREHLKTLPGYCRWCGSPEHPSGTMCSQDPSVARESRRNYGNS